ncbi:MAG: nitrate transporter substrate-binding protein [Hyphomicrobiales bacterium]|nr:nitrate transporter substrate-binding protein [Hyphomicrobiales bacterium]
MVLPNFSRRNVLQIGAGLAATIAMPALISGRTLAQSGTKTINMQLGWLGGGNQLGEIVAKHLGYFEEQGLNFAIQPGGPNNDGVAIVASGQYEIGQVSSSPSLMLAASHGIPVKAFAVCAQQHPYAFFSLASKPISTPKDMIGKKIGIQATGRPLLSALLKVNKIAEGDVEVVVIGSDMTPVLTGQVDAISGWVTNTTALAPLGPDHVTLKLWDNGVQLYANPYYTTAETLASKGDLLASFLKASGKGWEYAKANPEAAVDLLIKEFPNLVKKDELAAAPVMLKHVFTPATQKGGWGTFDPAIWDAQIKLYSQLGQFSAGTPALDAVETTVVLDATADSRPKIG